MGGRVNITQLFYPYWDWECYKNGMYTDAVDVTKIEECESLLLDTEMFLHYGKEMVDSWPISCDNFLSNSSINRIAWIGQAVCCYCFSANEQTVKKAWKQIPPIFQNKANDTAKEILGYYFSKNKKIRTEMEKKML